MRKLKLLLLAFGLFFPLFSTLAQGGSVAREPAPPPDGTPRAAVTPTETVVTPPRVTTEPTPVVTPLPPAPTPVEPRPAEVFIPVQKIDTPEEKSSGLLPWQALAGASVLVGGYFVAQSLKKKSTKKNEKDGSRCFDIKKLLDEKLKELTDIRGRIKSEAENMAREKIQEAVSGTAAGTALASLEKIEKEYKKLKKLYEECTIEFGKDLFKGMIIHESLADKSILKKINVEKMHESGATMLYDVFVTEEQIKDIQKYLAAGPWYVHFWKPRKDEVCVVFKDRTFTLKHSDRSTWSDAIAYGKSIGISEEQLDFPIDE